MSGSMEGSKLHVEGVDDKKELEHLLSRHGIGLSARPPRGIDLNVKELGGIENLLKGMGTAISAATDQSIGFVLDANAFLPDLIATCNVFRAFLCRIAFAQKPKHILAAKSSDGPANQLWVNSCQGFGITKAYIRSPFGLVTGPVVI